MGIKMKGLGVWWMMSLLSVAGLAATGSDVRLVDAVKQGDKETVRSLLKQHADVNTPQTDGATALQWASYRDDLETADLLIGAGARVNAANDYGVTPLSLACNNGSAAMVDRLLKAGAATSADTFMKCARSGNLEAVKSMLAHGADANAKETREGQTALMWAMAAKHPEVGRALVEHGADVNASAKSGFTALMFAAQQGDMESIRMLLAAGAKVNQATEDGDTALLISSASGHEALSIFLLDKGADANAADVNGFTALHYALMDGLALLSRVKIQRTKERLLVPHLARPNMVELVKALLAHGANPNARVKKPPTGDPLAIGDKLLRVSGVTTPVGTVSPIGATPFLMAAATYDTAVMRILLAAGADPKLTTDENVSALMLASGMIRLRTTPLEGEEEARALETVKMCLELGNDINAADYLGLTPLHAAAFVGSNKIVQLLVDKGAALNPKDKVGQTPLEKASNIKPPDLDKVEVDASLVPIRGYKPTADLLLKLGANPVSASVARKAADATAATATK